MALLSLLKEQLRVILHVKSSDAIGMLEQWCARTTSRCRIPALVALGRRIRAHGKGILDALVNGRTGGSRRPPTSGSWTRIAYGFKEPEHLIALALPGR